jgi:hypothetical protein
MLPVIGDFRPLGKCGRHGPGNRQAGIRARLDVLLKRFGIARFLNPINSSITFAKVIDSQKKDARVLSGLRRPFFLL